MRQYLALDLGGTFAKIGLVDEDYKILAREEAFVAFDGYQTPILNTVNKVLKSFLQKEKSRIDVLSGIGVAACGQIDSERGIVLGTCGTIPGWTGTAIKEQLEQKYQLPVSVMNDANAMCYGECQLGRGKGYRNVIGLTYGTGVGGGILCDGKLLEGGFGLAGELGHFSTHAGDGRPCTCGSVGCYEQYASVTALMKDGEKYNPRWKDAKVLFDAATHGDTDALKVLDVWTDEVAFGLVGLVHIFNPQLLLLGGGVSSQVELFIEPVRRKVLSSVMPAFGKELHIQDAALGNDAGMLGAVYRLREKIESEGK